MATVTWKDYPVTKPERFTISLPESWQAIDPAQLADAAALEQLEQQNPALAGVIRSSVEQMRAGNIAFVGLDPASICEARPFADNVNVVPPKATINAANWGAFVTQSMGAVQQALKLPAAPSASPIALPGADRAVETTYDYDLATPTGVKLTVAVRQYLILHGGKPFVLSLTTTRDQLDGREALFREIANRFKPGA